MTALPSVPSFTQGEHSIANLQQLSWAASFLADCDYRPNWTLYRSAVTGALTASTWTTLALNTVALDSDGVSDGTGALLNTQGYYHVEACGISFNTGASGSVDCAIRFMYTIGANNPHLTNGTTGTFAERGSVSNNVAGTDTCLATSSGTPYTMFPGDKIYVQAFCGASVLINNNNNNNFLQGRFAPRFTGIWIGQGQ